MTGTLITAGVFLFIYWLIFATLNAWSYSIDFVAHKMRDEIGMCYTIECLITEDLCKETVCEESPWGSPQTRFMIHESYKTSTLQ